MKESKRILIVTDFTQKSTKFYIDQMPKLAKGFIRLGHDVRIFSYLQEFRMLSPFKSRSMSARLYKAKVDTQLFELVEHYEPHLIYIGLPKYIDTITIEGIRKKCPNAIILGNDGDPWPSLQKGRIETAKAFDIMLATNNGIYLDEYRQAGIGQCFFMPNICDPDIDHRYQVGQEWKSDLLWTGKLTHQAGSNDVSREQVIKAISSYSGVKIYGCLGNPAVTGKDYFYAISGARLGIHLNVVNDVEMYHSDRLTHYLACGTCALSMRIPETERLFRDKQHVVYYDTIEEMHHLIDYYLAHESERQAIADQGMVWVHQEFNSVKIAQYILDIIETGGYQAPWMDWEGCNYGIE